MLHFQITYETYTCKALGWMFELSKVRIDRLFYRAVSYDYVFGAKVSDGFNPKGLFYYDRLPSTVRGRYNTDDIDQIRFNLQEPRWEGKIFTDVIEELADGVGTGLMPWVDVVKDSSGELQRRFHLKLPYNLPTSLDADGQEIVFDETSGDLEKVKYTSDQTNLINDVMVIGGTSTADVDTAVFKQVNEHLRIVAR